MARQQMVTFFPTTQGKQVGNLYEEGVNAP
jgi:hypothetical protein